MLYSKGLDISKALNNRYIVDYNKDFCHFLANVHYFCGAERYLKRIKRGKYSVYKTV